MPEHSHLTEGGRVQKGVIDRGGTIRSLASCLLQIWLADDEAHRLQATKFAGIS